MKRVLGLIALAGLACSPARAADSAVQSAPVGSEEVTPAVSKIVDFVKTLQGKTLVYFELDDARPGGQPVVGNAIMLQPTGMTKLITYRGDKIPELLRPIVSEAIASGKEGWRTIEIIVDENSTSVERGPRIPIEGFDARLKAKLDTVFPGHS